jgi:UDP-N-acetylglucosamine transferase subunit ALG13
VFRGVRAVIFVTVGAQMPFDRLVRIVDDWAAATGRTDVFAQIGPSLYRPRCMSWQAFLEPADFREKVFEAEVVITHAGMGTMLTALELGTPLLIMPRRGQLKETRNDHQFGTARAFADAGRAAVAWDDGELRGALLALDALTAPAPIASHASFRLLTCLRRFIRPQESVVSAEAVAAATAPGGASDRAATRKAA